ncbi:cshA, partial [Ophiophagus hannah]
MGLSSSRILPDQSYSTVATFKICGLQLPEFPCSRCFGTAIPKHSDSRPSTMPFRLIGISPPADIKSVGREEEGGRKEGDREGRKGGRKEEGGRRKEGKKEGRKKEGEGGRRQSRKKGRGREGGRSKETESIGRVGRKEERGRKMEGEGRKERR